MPRCRNKACKAKLPKGTLPMVCSDDCRNAVIKEAIAKSNAAAQRAIKKAKNFVEREAKEQRRALRRKKEDMRANDHKWQTARTQVVFNEFIRLLDRDRPCISCGRNECGTVWDCGHFKTVGAHPQLRFEPRNAFKQGSNCNRPHERRRGSAASVADGFQRGIIERFGHAHLQWLGGYHPPKHYSCPELAELRNVYAAEVKRLKQGLPPSRDWRALPEAQEQAT